MLDQDTLNWVKEQLQQGYTEDQIKEALIENGFDEEEISISLKDSISDGSNIFSILCLVFFFIPFLSVILGIISIRKIINENAKGKAVTFIGLLISTIPWILISSFFLIYFGDVSITALFAVLIIPILIIILGFYFINKTIKEKSHSLGAVYIFGALFILIFPVSLAYISYFGAMSPNDIPLSNLEQDFDTDIASEKITGIDNELPDSCSIGPPSIFSCAGWKADSSGLLTISVKYHENYDISNFNLIVGRKCNPEGINFKAGETKEFRCEIPESEPGKKYKKSLLIEYKDNENNLKEIPGKLRVTYE
ncbi:MAG: hypothetical protein PHV16_02250 [Candidatus Nanoarchaeia archaeon]|nr:hypothetical protein [Candidatus Nanoarchaeia archaeon]